MEKEHCEMSTRRLRNRSVSTMPGRGVFVPGETRPIPEAIKEDEEETPRGIIDRPDTLGDPTGTGEAQVLGVRSGNDAPDKMDSTLKYKPGAMPVYMMPRR